MDEHNVSAPVQWGCPNPGYHEYAYQDGRIICKLHGQWLGRIVKETK